MSTLSDRGVRTVSVVFSLFESLVVYDWRHPAQSPGAAPMGRTSRTPCRLQRSRISPLWKTMSLNEFSTSTSLHGWHFIHDATDGKHKVAWGLLIGLSISSLEQDCSEDKLYLFSDRRGVCVRDHCGLPQQ